MTAWLARSILVLVGLLPALATGAPASVEPAATQPARAASSAPRDLRRLVAGLSDPDPAERDRARFELLSLDRDDLPAVRAAAAQLRPLEPAVIQELRQIVAHAYLSGEPYPRDTRGFLGITMPELPEIGVRTSGYEVVVRTRTPGFCGFRWLKDGDVILDIEDRPMGEPVRRPEFLAAMARFKPGDRVRLKVLRQGQKISVPVVLDARPISELGDLGVSRILEERTELAADYWRKHFAPVLEPGGDETKRGGIGTTD